VHLGELLAQLVSGGRQIICSVEDPALADLLCRRLPVRKFGTATRITLGVDSDGALAQLDSRHVYASRTRFIPDGLLGLFEMTSWPPLAVGAQARVVSQGVRLNVGGRVRGMWR
jgi:hypothetical protein